MRMYGAEETNLAGFRIASLAAVRICSLRGAGWCVRLMIDLGRLALLDQFLGKAGDNSLVDDRDDGRHQCARRQSSCKVGRNSRWQGIRVVSVMAPFGRGKRSHGEDSRSAQEAAANQEKDKDKIKAPQLRVKSFAMLCRLVGLRLEERW